MRSAPSQLALVTRWSQIARSSSALRRRLSCDDGRSVATASFSVIDHVGAFVAGIGESVNGHRHSVAHRRAGARLGTAVGGVRRIWTLQVSSSNINTY